MAFPLKKEEIEQKWKVLEHLDTCGLLLLRAHPEILTFRSLGSDFSSSFKRAFFFKPTNLEMFPLSPSNFPPQCIWSSSRRRWEENLRKRWSKCWLGGLQAKYWCGWGNKELGMWCVLLCGSVAKADRQGKEHMCVLPHMNGTEMDEKSGYSLVKKESCGWKEKVCNR